MVVSLTGSGVQSFFWVLEEHRGGRGVSEELAESIGEGRTFSLTVFQWVWAGERGSWKETIGDGGWSEVLRMREGFVRRWAGGLFVTGGRDPWFRLTDGSTGDDPVPASYLSASSFGLFLDNPCSLESLSSIISAAPSVGRCPSMISLGSILPSASGRTPSSWLANSSVAVLVLSPSPSEEGKA
jgi:hypothetical protein